MVRLGVLGQIITGNTPKTTDAENYASKDIAFIKPSDIQENKLTMLSGAEFYISEYAREKARILIPGCILVTCIGIVGKVAINNIECALAQKTLNLSEIKKISLPIPPMNTQRKFCKFVEQVNGGKSIIEHSLDKLEILEKALMQQYFG